jgi:tetratricopeptide (TPR) repeat protein
MNKRLMRLGCPIYMLLVFYGFTAFFTGLFAQNMENDREVAGQYFSRGAYQEAVAVYRSMLKRAPRDAAAAYNLGNSLYRAGDYPAAAAAYRQAIRHYPVGTKRADAWHNLGNVLFRQGEFALAVDAYSQSLRISPGSLPSIRNLQLALKEMERNAAGSGSSGVGRAGVTGSGGTSVQEGGRVRLEKSMEEARQLLEAAVAPHDMRTMRKYREAGKRERAMTSEKDW